MVKGVSRWSVLALCLALAGFQAANAQLVRRK
jgi:hypothetical protein